MIESQPKQGEMTQVLVSQSIIDEIMFWWVDNQDRKMLQNHFSLESEPVISLCASHWPRQMGHFWHTLIWHHHVLSQGSAGQQHYEFSFCVTVNRPHKSTFKTHSGPKLPILLFCLKHPVEQVRKPKLEKVDVKVETLSTVFIIPNQFVK